ncbi:MAG TPA: hypothetical protein VF344_06715 [Candidatus Limnocylindrales bacterium]
MIRLTLKQHRFETIAITILCLGLAVAGVVEALRLYALNTPAACLGNGGYGGYMSGPMMTGIGAAPTGFDPCQAAMNARYGLTSSIDFSLVGMLFLFAPFIAGITFGAPLVARELEQGTAPLSWSLAGSRRRWLLFRMLAMGGLLVVLLGAVAISSDVYQGTMSPTVDVHSSFATYTYRGVIDIFWGLAAFLGTVALGTIFGRTLPAVFVAVVICFFARGGWEPVMNRVVLQPMGQLFMDPAKMSDPNSFYIYTPSDLTLSWPVYLDGKPWSGDINVWFQEHTQFDANGQPIGPSGAPESMPQSVPFGLHGDRYWPVVALESGILLLGSLLCGAVALVWVDRRRPY